MFMIMMTLLIHSVHQVTMHGKYNFKITLGADRLLRGGFCVELDFVLFRSNIKHCTRREKTS